MKSATRRLQKLRQLNGYLRDLSLPERPEVKFSYVTAYADASERLATASGIQVLVARPEMRQETPDGQNPGAPELETAVFILEKDLGAYRTDAREREAYDDMESIADAILAAVYDATDSCRLVAGVRCTGFEMVPETSVFGGWFGYSLVIRFE